MFLRALLAFIALPGVVAIAVPIVILRLTNHIMLEQPWALAVLALGFSGMLWCVRDFYVAGKGTLAPWSPPTRLVVIGLYRYSRNPMYVALTLILLGWTLAFRSSGMLVYTLAVVVAVHLRVVFGEEPWLARTHGREWEQFAARVPRWLWRM